MIIARLKQRIAADLDADFHGQLTGIVAPLAGAAIHRGRGGVRLKRFHVNQPVKRLKS
jgi:hypothetical protein